eukprot:UN01528
MVFGYRQLVNTNPERMRIQIIILVLGIDYATNQGQTYKSGSASNRVYAGEASMKGQPTSCQGTDHGSSCSLGNSISYVYSIYVKTPPVTSVCDPDDVPERTGLNIDCSDALNFQDECIVSTQDR